MGDKRLHIESDSPTMHCNTPMVHPYPFPLHVSCPYFDAFAILLNAQIRQ